MLAVLLLFCFSGALSGDLLEGSMPQPDLTVSRVREGGDIPAWVTVSEESTPPNPLAK